ncbi:hypothetical protein GGQ74_002141 [Desulfobaculum xiamenense]|uniref:Uncharacterized protein n=1 Tax=Desulfobaculum xiamenense TaxID=995050 RepID=A0A846QJS5_9BACT|nr:hypothetical protein [Desulfobaculum xiamenense]
MDIARRGRWPNQRAVGIPRRSGVPTELVPPKTFIGAAMDTARQSILSDTLRIMI